MVTADDKDCKKHYFHLLEWK